MGRCMPVGLSKTAPRGGHATVEPSKNTRTPCVDRMTVVSMSVVFLPFPSPFSWVGLPVGLTDVRVS